MMIYPLCVVVPEVGVLSETFLDWDVNHLLPGGTVVISDPPPRGETVVGAPSWSTAAPTLTFAPQPGDPWPGPERRESAARFIREHGVEIVLVEFLDLGQRWFDTLSTLGVDVWLRGHGADLTARLSHTYRDFADASGLIVPSEAAKRRLCQVGLAAGSVHVVPNHVVVPPVAPRRRHDEEHVRCISVGRLVPKKGFRYLLEAFRRAAAHEPRLRLEIIGDGPMRGDLERAIDAASLQERVALPGALPPERVRARLDTASIYVHHAVTGPDGDTEGMPLTILEAMAACLPLVLSRHEGLDEIANGSHAAIYTEERDVDATARALRRLAACPAQRQEMGRVGWALARERFSHDRIRPHLLDLIGVGGGCR